MTDLSLGRWPEVSLMQARQIARRKRKELGQEPPRGYVLQDAFRLWCNLKRGRISCKLGATLSSTVLEVPG